MTQTKFDYITFTKREAGIPFSGFKPATCLCLSEDMTWTSRFFVICFLCSRSSVD